MARRRAFLALIVFTYTCGFIENFGINFTLTYSSQFDDFSSVDFIPRHVTISSNFVKKSNVFHSSSVDSVRVRYVPSLIASSVALTVHLASVEFSSLQLVCAPRPTCKSKRSRRYQQRAVVCLLLMISGIVHPRPGPALVKHTQPAYLQLSLNGMKYIDVPGDGHCFIHALRISIMNFFGVHMSVNDVSAFLRGSATAAS